MALNKKPNSGHVIYDSGNDTTTGKKRAVIPGGGVSVAERARLFGSQIANLTPSKTYHSVNELSPRPQSNNQSTKANVIHQERNHQPPKTDIDRRSRQNTSYPNSQQIPNTYRSASNVNERPKRDQIPPINSRNYSKPTRAYNHNSHSPSHQQPIHSYDSFQRVSLQRQPSHKTKYPQRIPGDSFSSEDEDTYSALYNQPKSSHTTNTYQPSSHFRPIQDPLEVLFKDSPKDYIQQQAPVRPIEPNMNDVQPFDLGKLINRIQQDYMDNARPYVSSVQFVEHKQSLANIGFITPATNRKDYMRRPEDLYNRRVPTSNYYDVIDTNGFYPSNQMQPRHEYADNNYSSIRRRRQHRRYHNQASSPIHVMETNAKINSRQQPESVPVPIPPKVPTPVATSSEEEEETTTQATLTKAKETESSSEAESEEESVEQSAVAPALPPSLQIINDATRALANTGTPVARPAGFGRPPLPNQTPTTTARGKPQASESEESESDDSESESASDSDDDRKKPKPKPLPTSRGTPSTPQATTRVVAPQRGNYETTSLDQPPESSHSVKSFDVQDSGKSSSFGGKIKSLTNKFRRKKS